MSGTAKKDSPALSDLLKNKEESKVESKDVNTQHVLPGERQTSKTEAADLPIGPDSNKDNVRVEKENTNKEQKPPVDEPDKTDKPELSNQVVGTVPNKTPAELASETPAETAERYGIDQSINDQDADNPRVQVYRDTKVNQVPSGTHLHPDIAKDLLNRGISEQHTDNAQVTRQVTEYYDFAPDAAHNDKM